jgi:hypothetical protein
MVAPSGSEAEEKMHRDLLATDFAPSGVRARCLNACVEEDERRICDVDIKISCLELQLQELRARRHAFIESSAMKKALLAPMRTLTPEVLGEVFSWCIHATMDVSDGRGSIAADAAPLLLGRVCKRWRRVALGTPHLWTTLSLTTILTVNPLVVVPMWLHHSKSLPIDIYISPDWSHLPCGHSLSEGVQTNVLQYISHHVHRCRVFHYCASPKALEELFRSGRDIHAPFLHDLRIEPTTHFPRDWKCGKINAPNLQSLHIDDPQILLELIHTDHHADSFRHLRSLSLGWVREEDIIQMLEILYTPSIASLSLTTWCDNTPSLAPALRNFLSASTPPLKELRLIRPGIHVCRANLTSILDVLPSLESLYLLGVDLSAAFLTALTPKSMEHPTTWLLPRLRSLHLESVNLTGPVNALLVRMVESRNSHCNHWHADNREGFKRLIHVVMVDCQLPRIQQATWKRLVRDFKGFAVEGLEDCWDCTLFLLHSLSPPN